jgi:D-glycero-D-manno-heptose 1,7-bisphosphate phosphatase
VLVQLFPSLTTVEVSPSIKIPPRAPVARIAFLDRDGVVNANRSDHVKSWDEFKFLPGALDALTLLSRSGWRIVVVTNQAIVNRGQITTARLRQLHNKMAESIVQHGGELSAVYACPHRQDEGCRCRKPEPGLLVAAANHLAGRLDHAIMVGDHLTDLEAARRAGCRSILVSSGRHRPVAGEVLPDNCLAIVPDLLAAAHEIIGGGLTHGSRQTIEWDGDSC